MSRKGNKWGLPKSDHIVFFIPIIMGLIGVGMAFLLPTFISIKARKPYEEIVTRDDSLRIISLAPSITEILFELGLKDNIVGVTKQCDYPNDAKKIEKIGSYNNPSIEKIIKLKPSLVFCVKEGNIKSTIDALDNIGIKTYVLPNNDIKDLFSSIKKIGILTNIQNTALKLVQELEGELKKLKKLTKNAKKKKVLWIVGYNPLYVAGKGAHLDALIKLCGGVNVAEDSHIMWPKYNMEMVIRKNPDVILDCGHGTKVEDRLTAPTKAEKIWGSLQCISAVKNKRIYKLNPNIFARVTPRMVRSLKNIARLIQPELFNKKSNQE